MTNSRALLSVALLAGTAAACYRADLSAGVRQSTIREVQLGMAPAEVIALLGEPKAREVSDDRLTLTFSAPVRGARQFPMLWVHFRTDRVVEVYGKRYFMFGVDDEGAYGLSERGKWEARYFEETFPK